MTNPTVALQLDPETLRPLIERAVEATLTRLESVRSIVPNRLAWPEGEAAALLGLAPHQLRDERLRGRIAASRLVGRRVYYLHSDLMSYLLRDRVNDSAGGEA